MLTAPQLNTTRLALRPLSQQDLPAFTLYRQQPEVARYQGWSDYDMGKAEALLNAQLGGTFGAADSWFQMAIVDKDTDALLGDLALHFIDENQLEIGFTLAPQHQGQGLAKEAVTCLLDWYLLQSAGHRVTAICDTENLASWRLLEALGFRREAHWVENIFFKGAWGSEYQYALLAREWRSRPVGIL